jgi:hypothetical protein
VAVELRDEVLLRLGGCQGLGCAGEFERAAGEGVFEGGSELERIGFYPPCDSMVDKIG